MKQLEEFLRRTLKTDPQYLFKGSLQLAGGQFVASLSGLLLTIGLTNTLDPSHYGLYSYIFSIAGIVVAFTLSGMDTAVAQSVAKGFDKNVIEGFWIKLRWSIPVGILTCLAGIYYLFRNDEILGFSLLIVGIFTPIIYACSLYGSYFNGRGQFGKIAFDNSLKNVTSTIIVFFVALTTQNIILIVLSFFLTNAIISMVRFLLLSRKIKSETKETHKKLPSLSFGKHLSLMDAFSVISSQLDKILVFQLLGASSLAMYALALAPTKQLQGITKIIRTLIIPRFSKRSIEEIHKTMKHKAIIFFAASFITLIGYWIAAPYIFNFMFPKYTDAILISQVLALGLLFMPFMLHTQVLTSLEDKKSLYILNASKPFIRAALLVILIPFYGIWGAVWALLAFYVIHYTMLYILYTQHASRKIKTHS